MPRITPCDLQRMNPPAANNAYFLLGHYFIQLYKQIKINAVFHATQCFKIGQIFDSGEMFNVVDLIISNWYFSLSDLRIIIKFPLVYVLMRMEKNVG